MKLNQEHNDFENYCKKLIGLTIVKVEYAEIAYQFDSGTLPKPFYNTKYPDLNTVDFSIFLHTNNNDVIEVCWDGVFFQFGIGLKLNKKSNFSGFQKWNVTDNIYMAGVDKF